MNKSGKQNKWGEKNFQGGGLQDYEIRLTLSNMVATNRLTEKNQRWEQKGHITYEKATFRIGISKVKPQFSNLQSDLAKASQVSCCTAEAKLKKKLSQFKLANTYERLHGAVHHIAAGMLVESKEEIGTNWKLALWQSNDNIRTPKLESRLKENFSFLFLKQII